MSKIIRIFLFFFISLTTFLNGLTTSIIVPCCIEHFKLLDELFDNYNKQTVLPDQMVISISGMSSIDVKMLRNYRFSNTPLFPVAFTVSNRNLYPGENRNIACGMALGDILICNDADDIPHHQRVEIIKKIFETNKIDVLVHRWSAFDDKEFRKNYLNINKIPIWYSTTLGDEFCDKIHYGNVSLRKSVSQNVKWKDIMMGEDKTFINEAIRNNYIFGILDAKLINYRLEYSYYQNQEDDEEEID